MNSSRANTQTQNPAIIPPAASPTGCYLAASPMSDIMFDQLEYLLAHAAERASRSQHCAPDCMDCARLQQVKNWLLMPFHSAVHSPVQ